VMPGSSGVDLAKELQGERPGLRVAYMSGYPDNAALRAGLAGAPGALLQKPFSTDRLLEKVAALLR
jgi:FixJ family two-component response regulator